MKDINVPKFIRNRGGILTQAGAKRGVIPKYVHLNNRILKYDAERMVFHHDRGDFDVKFESREGKFFSVSNIEAINNKELTPASREEWVKDNEETR